MQHALICTRTLVFLAFTCRICISSAHLELLNAWCCLMLVHSCPGHMSRSSSHSPARWSSQRNIWTAMFFTAMLRLIFGRETMAPNVFMFVVGSAGQFHWMIGSIAQLWLTSLDSTKCKMLLLYSLQFSYFLLIAGNMLGFILNFWRQNILLNWENRMRRSYYKRCWEVLTWPVLAKLYDIVVLSISPKVRLLWNRPNRPPLERTVRSPTPCRPPTLLGQKIGESPLIPSGSTRCGTQHAESWRPELGVYLFLWVHLRTSRTVGNYS